MYPDTYSPRELWEAEIADAELAEVLESERVWFPEMDDVDAVILR